MRSGFEHRRGMRKSRKRHSTKKVGSGAMWAADGWAVRQGELKRPVGNPGTQNLFRFLGEKLPIGSLEALRKKLKTDGIRRRGVYIAHDSMGCPRYVGRGNIFARLKTRAKRYPRELVYYSFYVVEDPKHEREIETLLIRAAAFLLEFNERKKRVGISPESVRDYEAGTRFFERQRKKGRKRDR